VGTSRPPRGLAGGSPKRNSEARDPVPVRTILDWARDAIAHGACFPNCEL
jgi:hypothetical protein